MNQDEFQTLLASLASQYAEACQEELEALKDEALNQHHLSDLKTRLLMHAYNGGQISGKNKEIRDVQADSVLEQGKVYKEDREYLDKCVNNRKRATMVRIGVENEWKTWRAWLMSTSGGNDR